MVSRGLFFSSLFLHLAPSLGRQNGKAGMWRRDEIPMFPSDPNTTKYCTWWWDNDGSIPCADMPAAWSLDPEEFRRWNPSIDAACGGFDIGKSYCVEAFGEPPPSSTTDIVSSAVVIPSSTAVVVSTSVVVSSTSQPSSAALPPATTTTSPATPATTAAGNGIVTPTPIQPGMVSNCNKFHLVAPGDDCWNIAVKYSIAMTDVVDMNPSVNSLCDGLWAAVYVCVGVVDDVAATSVEPATTSVSPPTTTTAPGNGITTPTPIQPGMVSNCNRFHFVVAGDDCWNIAAKYSIEMADVVALNPSVKSDCSGLWVSVNICISTIEDMATTSIEPATTSVNPPTTTSVNPPTTTAPGNGVTTPTPIQPGMVSNCNKFHWIAKGVVCSQITSYNRISLADFAKWNPSIERDCSGMWAEVYVCVGVIGGATPTTTLVTTTSKGNGVATPTPFQAGIVKNCKTFKKVVSGDTCATIATKAGVPLANFYKWNPGVGSACQTLWLDNYVCIATL